MIEVLWGANLVGMSVLPLDACPLSWLFHKFQVQLYFKKLVLKLR